MSAAPESGHGANSSTLSAPTPGLLVNRAVGPVVRLAQDAARLFYLILLWIDRF
ncbi:MAG TPA: hypothetical protein VMS82_09715 [Pseudolabrys sp.]|nr:hypothetical protein [Pseudolabrys sp.]